MDEEKRQAPEPQGKTWKDKLYSEKAMKYVNGILCVTIIFGIPLGTVIAYSLWLAYLICGIVVRREDKALRIVYGVLSLIAATVVVLNLVSLIKALAPVA